MSLFYSRGGMNKKLPSWKSTLCMIPHNIGAITEGLIPTRKVARKAFLCWLKFFFAKLALFEQSVDRIKHRYNIRYDPLSLTYTGMGNLSRKSCPKQL